jgi:hypothetical protein
MNAVRIPDAAWSLSMSSQITTSNNSTPSTRRPTIICHAVETDIAVSSPCTRHLDPAVLVGLSLAYARQRAAVPAAIAVPLTQLADHGDATCRLVVDWLEYRSAPVSGSDQSAVAVATYPPVARSHRQRAIDGPRVGSTPQPQKARGRSRSRFAKAEIISATEENR